MAAPATDVLAGLTRQAAQEGVALQTVVVENALYLVVMLKGLALRPMPFMLSFTGYYVALHIAEAVLLRRLLANRVSSVSGESRVS